MNRITRASLMLATVSTAFPAAAQDSVADATARLQMEQLRLAVEKARLEPLTALAAQSGSTASVEGQADTAEAFMLKHAVYDRAVTEVVKRLPDANGAVSPIVLFGSVPPSLDQWFTFRDNARTLIAASQTALASWRKAKNAVESSPSNFVTDPMTLFAIAGVAISLLKTDSVIKGSALKVEDAALATMLARHMVTKGYASDYFALQMSRSGDADATELMSRGYVAGSPATLAGSHDGVVKALGVYLGAKDVLAERAKAEPDSDRGRAARNAISAGEGLVAAAAAYTALRASLLASTNGITNATHIRRQKDLAESTAATRPILYILNHTAALTTITKKNLFVGLRSTPATLRVAVRIDYLWMGAEPRRAAVTCLTGAIPFDSSATDGGSRASSNANCL